MSRKHAFLPWVMWVCALSFFGFQFILRQFPGLVIEEFYSKFAINASEFGIFAAFYYIGYSGFQIPMAILLDRYGPRMVISSSVLLCALAGSLLYKTDSWPLAILSRFLIGVGSSVGFLGVSKVISLWFPREQYTRLVGFSFSIGLMGAVLGTQPTRKLINAYGWQEVVLILSCIAFALAFFIFLVVKSKKQGSDADSLTSPMLEKNFLQQLLQQKSLVYIAIANFLMVGSLEGFADLWGNPFFMVSKHLTSLEAATIIPYVFFGMLFGGPILAYLSERFNAHYKVTFYCGILLAILLSTIIWANSLLSIPLIKGLMFMIGILCCYQVIIFAIGEKQVNVKLLSITVALLNCINMLGGAFFHWMIGQIMDLIEPERVALEGVNSYELSTYQLTLSIIPLAALIGAILVAWSKRQRRLEVFH